VQGCGSGGVGIDYGSEGDRRSGILQLAKDADVVLAEGTGTKDGNVQNRALCGLAGI